MQTSIPGLKWLRGLLIAALYVSVFGCATPPQTTAPVAEPTTTEQQPGEEAPVVETGTVDIEQPIVTPMLPRLAEGAEHHIALILPLRSPLFGRAAEAVQLGFLSAAEQQPNELPVRIYSSNDEKFEVEALYRLALEQGALAVAGPLTRGGVAALAENPALPVPTLAMNVLEIERTDQLYFFGLPPELEARQAAQWAASKGLLSATVVRTDSALSNRLAQAFTEEWQRTGGVLWPDIVYEDDPSEIRLLGGEAGSMVFLAAEPDKARLMRPYIFADIPVYATSQIFTGNGNNLINYDLGEVRFYDMPWVMQPDHPAVMVYPHVEPPYTVDMERLFALGIDAYRMLQVLYHHNMINALPLDGVTGKLTLEGNRVKRDGVKSIMRSGQGMTMENALKGPQPVEPTSVPEE
ncbi:MAG: penicillin-binding protein activator [Gammaproteobacteria bacterium]|nr:penicillin-binding protein activator [Gammaproteobacteria bacterium]MBU1624531.1 penicillin-binding protein activator [Gammaproteobacteria bacterium]MBU1982375.1 penicillin-binding protein activator [Gammaproteobacteria bacterium]